MKGKGERGGGGGGGSSGGGGGAAVKATFDESCPLQFPSLKSIDHTRLCPRYTSIIGRSAEVNDGMDCVGLEEIDSLQSELETLSASVAKRMRLIQSELQILSSAPAVSTGSSSTEKGKDRDRSSSAGTPAATTMSSPGEPGTPGSGSKRVGKGKLGTVVSGGGAGGGGSVSAGGGGGEERPAKRMRTDSGRPTYAQPISSKGKGKVQPTSKQPAIDSLDSPKSASATALEPGATMSAPRAATKNMTPSRFWAMVEPYCAPITPDDIRYLDEQIKMCEDIAEYLKVPPLGRHYAEKWAEEDLEQEQRDGGKANERRKGVNSMGGATAGSNGLSNGAVSVDTATLLKRLNDNDDESSPFGPLTQRLIQGLLEENLMTSLDDDLATISEADAVEAATISPKSLAKQLHLGNTAVLERRIKRELEEVGIFGLFDDEKTVKDGGGGGKGGEGGGGKDEDEILTELRRKQSELKALSHQNTSMLRHLLSRAKEEMAQQELREKLTAADNEVIEAYRRVQAAKAKKKTPTKKEKDQFYKTLRDRDLIAKQIAITTKQESSSSSSSSISAH